MAMHVECGLMGKEKACRDNGQHRWTGEGRGVLGGVVSSKMDN